MNKLYEIKKMKKKNLEKAMNNLKPPIFWKDKKFFLNKLKNGILKKIKVMLKKTYNLEKKIKSNSLINKNIINEKI